MSVFSFEHQGRIFRMTYARSGAGVWIGWPGGARYFGPESARASEGGKPSLSSDEIRAPMTGRVIQVCRVAGDRVKAGESIVILEAMKMEYRLAAPREGRIESVRCREGDQVDLGRTLVTFERGAKS